LAKSPARQNIPEAPQSISAQLIYGLGVLKSSVEFVFTYGIAQYPYSAMRMAPAEVTEQCCRNNKLIWRDRALSQSFAFEAITNKNRTIEALRGFEEKLRTDD